VCLGRRCDATRVYGDAFYETAFAIPLRGWNSSPTPQERHRPPSGRSESHWCRISSHWVLCLGGCLDRTSPLTGDLSRGSGSASRLPHLAVSRS